MNPSELQSQELQAVKSNRLVLQIDRLNVLDNVKTHLKIIACLPINLRTETDNFRSFIEGVYESMWEI